MHLAIAFTRSVEDTGRLDILTAGAVHRLAPSAAGVTAAAVPAALTVAFSTLALVLLGYPGTGSLLYAGGLGMFMVAFTAAGAVAAQCCRDARTAYVLAVGFWLASYLTRAVVDVRGWNVTWVNPESWLSRDPALLGRTAVVALVRVPGADRFPVRHRRSRRRPT
nr:hypothetical protein GCM10020092_080140 [Actinoplanes digitatis]